MTVGGVVTTVRVETRVTGLVWSGAGVTCDKCVAWGGYGIAPKQVSGTALVYFNMPDTVTPGVGNCDVALGTSPPSDLSFRVQRDLVAGTVLGEVYNFQTSALLGSCTQTITGAATGAAIVGGGITLGGTNASGATSFLHVFNTLATPGAAPIWGLATAAQYANYTFSPNPGNGTDSNSGGFTGQNITSGGTLVYVNSTTYSPSCAFKQLSAQLGSTNFSPNPTNGCIPLDGGTTLTYLWSNYGMCKDGKTNSPTFSSATAAQPSITGGLTQPGCLNLQVTVTDSLMVPATFVIVDGVVPWNAGGKVNLGVGGWALSANAQLILGDLVAYGQNTWTFADSTTLLELQLQSCNIGISAFSSYCTTPGGYPPYWRTPIVNCHADFTSGSASVTIGGSGSCNAQTLGCGGGSSPVNSNVFVWTYAGTETAPITHYTQASFTCPDSTHFLMGAVYPVSPISPWPSAPTNVPFSIHSPEGTDPYAYWRLDGAPGNYYDNVLGGYATYFRTGFDTAFDFADTMGKYWLEYPQLDYFYNLNSFFNNVNPSGLPSYQYSEPRDITITGIILRYALGHTELLEPLRAAWNNYTYYMHVNFNGYTYDLRDMSYAQDGIALCVAVDPTYVIPAGSPLAGQTCLQRLQANLTTVGHNWLDIQSAGGGFTSLYGGVSSAPMNGSHQCTSCSVTMTPGSKNVTGTNTNFCAAGCGTAQQGQAFLSFSGTPSVNPPDNSTMDAMGYMIDTITDDTHLILFNNYAGSHTSGSGFAFSFDAGHGLVGYGVQPYMEGLAAQSFFTSALVDTSNASTWNALGHGSVSDAVATLYTDLGGFYFGTHFPGCEPPMHYATNAGNQGCITGFADGVNNPIGPSESRTLSMEAMRALAMDRAAGYSSNVSIATTLMTQMFGCPGYSPVGDGRCIDAYQLPIGFYVTGSAPNGIAPKWYGEMMGFVNAASAWLLQNSTGSSLSGGVHLSGNIALQ